MPPLPELRHDDVAALDEAHAAARIQSGNPADHVVDPRPGGVDHAARLGLRLRAGLRIGHLDVPEVAAPANTGAGGAGQYPGAFLFRVERVQHHESGIVHPTVGIFEGLAIGRLDRSAFRGRAQVEHPRARETLRPPR